MSVRFDADPARQWVVVTVLPGVRWVSFHADVRAKLHANPEWADWHWIVVDQGPMDDVDVPAMVETGKVFCSLIRRPGVQTYTVTVVADPHFGLWAPVIDNFYGGRRHLWSGSLEDAITLLERCVVADAALRPD
jgi:hypothetical protein